MTDWFEILRSGKENEFLEKIDLIDVNQTNELGRSLLHVAIARGQKHAASALVAKGANPNVQDKQHGYSPLHVAAEYGAADMVELLLGSGADPNTVDKHGNSPLWTAVFRSRAFSHGSRIVRMILAAGADASHLNKAGRTPLDMAVQFGDRNLITILATDNKKKPTQK